MNKSTPLPFEVGDIYKMTVASRSHVKEPYFVEIIEVGEGYIVTNIPGHHSLKISKSNTGGTVNNWDYHIPRMIYVGKKADYDHLIKNQKLIHK